MPVLYLRDGNGNFVPIPAIKGDNGKSAYEQAKEGGYTGTEAEFVAFLNGMTSSEDAAHYSNFNNPHNVTKEQLGLGNVDNVSVASHIADTSKHVMIDETGTIIIGQEATALGAEDMGDGVVIGTSAETKYGGVAIGKDAYSLGSCVAIGEEARVGGGNSISIGKSSFGSDGVAVGTNAYAFSGGVAIGKNAKASSSAGGSIQLGAGTNENVGTMQVYNYPLLEANGKIPSERLPSASGSYKGTNTYGSSKPNTLTFDFVPKLVIVSKRGETNAIGGGTFIWISPDTILNFLNNGSTYWCHPTLEGTTLSWYNAEGASYQLNSSSYEYDYFAWG